MYWWRKRFVPFNLPCVERMTRLFRLHFAGGRDNNDDRSSHSFSQSFLCSVTGRCRRWEMQLLSIGRETGLFSLRKPLGIYQTYCTASVTFSINTSSEKMSNNIVPSLVNQIIEASHAYQVNFTIINRGDVRRYPFGTFDIHSQCRLTRSWLEQIIFALFSIPTVVRYIELHFSLEEITSLDLERNVVYECRARCLADALKTDQVTSKSVFIDCLTASLNVP